MTLVGLALVVDLSYLYPHKQQTRVADEHTRQGQRTSLLARASACYDTMPPSAAADGTAPPEPQGTLTGKHDDSVWSVAWTPKGQLLSGSVDETLRVWNATPGGLELQHTFGGHRLGVVAVAASGTEPLAITSSIDCVLRLWDLEKGAQVGEIKAGPGEVWSAAWSPVAPLVASGSQAGKLNVWDVSNRANPVLTVLDTGAVSRFVYSVAFSPDGRRVACGGSDGEVHVFDLETQSLVVALQGHSKPVRGLAFAAQGHALLSASDDQRVNVHEMGRNALVSTYDGHSSWVLGVAASPDGRHFASCGADRRVKLWDLAMKDCVHTIDRHTEAVWSVAFNPVEPTQLASGSEDGQVLVTNVGPFIG